MYNQLNKTLYISAIIFLLSASVFVACQSKQEKMDEATAEATEAAANASENSTETTVVTTTTTEWQTYRESANATIENNQERIKTIREKIQKSNTPNLDKLREKRINELQDRNTALLAKIMEYKEDDVTVTLVDFKADIQKELNDMEKALKELDK